MIYSPRWPAEWEPQDAVWLSWPHRSDLWQGGLDELHRTFAAIAEAIAPYAEVRINAAAALHPIVKKALAEKNIDPDRFKLFDHPTNDVWCRDHGPIFTKDIHTGELHLTDWQFNAWGGKFDPWNLDNEIPARIADSLHLPLVSSQMILEGGAIEGNGRNLLITTESVLLNPNRNPDWNKEDMEHEIKRLLGTESIFWLGAGIEGDDTDGHIDDMVRFFKEDGLVAITEKDSSSANYNVLQENWERLQDIRTVEGSSIEVIPLPMPEPLIADNWRLEQLPASYANFLIVNEAVLVPIFLQKKNDDTALGILREAFPKHKVIGIDARKLVLEGGAIHCITQQQPSAGL